MGTIRRTSSSYCKEYRVYFWWISWVTRDFTVSKFIYCWNS